MAQQSAAATSVGRAREQFLTAADDEALSVRAEIQASWRRSRQLAVDTDRVEPAFVERLDHETLLARSAGPVLEALRSELAGEPIGILVTDAYGTVLERQCPDPDLVRRLDAARLAPGFVFSESSVGTNGIGVALEMRAPTMVTGAEHYVDSLKQFGCAGAPVLHPITGAFMGIVDFTASAPLVNPLLLTFARATAKRVQDRLLHETSPREVALMRDYLAACHHTGGSVLGLSDDLVMMNVHAQQHYDLTDQAALLAKLADAAGATDPQTVLTRLPSGETVRMEYRPAFSGGRLAGGVVRVQPSRPEHSAPSRRTPVATLPGVVGDCPVWRQTVRAVVASRADDEWLVLQGEGGVGKSLLARAAQERLRPEAKLTVVDAADVSSDRSASVAAALAEPGAGLLIQHVEALAPAEVRELTAQLQDAGAATGSWVALTMAGDAAGAELADLLLLFPRTIEVPPLRQHLADLDRIMAHLLSRLVRGAELTVAPEAMNRLRRLPWPGNVAQLREVLVRVTRRRRSGVIEVADLPPETRAGSRHQLSPLETLERDAIVEALAVAGGSKDRAAEALGLSRATIYRKIKAYGILTG